MADPFSPCPSVNKAGFHCWLARNHRGGIHETHPAERGKSREAGASPVWTDDRGRQADPVHRNLAPAILWARVHGWRDPPPQWFNDGAIAEASAGGAGMAGRG